MQLITDINLFFNIKYFLVENNSKENFQIREIINIINEKIYYKTIFKSKNKSSNFCEDSIDKGTLDNNLSNNSWKYYWITKEEIDEIIILSGI